MITIINYGLGNISAFVNVYKRLNIPIIIAQNNQDLAAATKLILPGVGAFDHAMLRLEESGMRQTLTELVCEKGIPLLGVCVGMQMLAETSEEGKLPGLGWIAGQIKKMYRLSQDKIPYPHMGWNSIKPIKSHPLFLDFKPNPLFYFLHSYYFECLHSENSIAEAYYGNHFTCAVNHKQIYGVQFHPEKSHHYGAQLLKNFADL